MLQYDAASPAAGSPLTAHDIIQNSTKLGFQSTLSAADAEKIVADYEKEGPGSLSFEGFLRVSQLVMSHRTMPYAAGLVFSVA